MIESCNQKLYFLCMNKALNTLLNHFDRNISSVAKHFGVSSQAASKWFIKGRIPSSRIYMASQITGLPIEVFLPKQKISALHATCSTSSQIKEIEVVDKKPAFINEPNPAP